MEKRLGKESDPFFRKQRGPIVLISGTVTSVLAFLPFCENLLTGEEMKFPLSALTGVRIQQV